MNLTINGEQQLTKASTIQDLLNELNISIEGIAVAINEEVISKNSWKEQALKQHDNILIITATQGG